MSLMYFHFAPFVLETFCSTIHPQVISLQPLWMFNPLPLDPLGGESHFLDWECVSLSSFLRARWHIRLANKKMAALASDILIKPSNGLQTSRADVIPSIMHVIGHSWVVLRRQKFRHRLVLLRNFLLRASPEHFFLFSNNKVPHQCSCPVAASAQIKWTYLQLLCSCVLDQVWPPVFYLDSISPLH